MFTIEKSYNKYISEGKICIEIILTFKIRELSFIFNASTLEKVYWSEFLTKDIHIISDQLTDKYGSHCDNGFVIIRKENNKLYFEADSAIGFGYKFNIPFEEAKEELQKLVDWYIEIKNN